MQGSWRDSPRKGYNKHRSEALNTVSGSANAVMTDLRSQSLEILWTLELRNILGM